MDVVRTVGIPTDLLASVQRASGAGGTETVERALRLVVAWEACAKLRQLRGGVRFLRTSTELKIDRVAGPTG